MARTVDPEKHAARRRAILGAAAGVFAEKGYEKTTTAAICRAAGIGSGTLFHYFGDKRSVFVALFADDRAVDQAVIDTLDDLPAAAALTRFLDHLVRDVADPLAPGLVWAAIDVAMRDPAFAAVLETNDAHNRAALARIVERLGTADVPPERASRWLHALVDTLYLMCGDEGFDAAAETAALHLMARRFLRLP